LKDGIEGIHKIDAVPETCSMLMALKMFALEMPSMTTPALGHGGELLEVAADHEVFKGDLPAPS